MAIPFCGGGRIAISSSRPDGRSLHWIDAAKSNSPARRGRAYSQRVFFGVDHLVLCGTRDDHRRLGERLVPAGFVPVPGRLRFDDHGVHSESLAYRDGAFVEVVYEVGPGAPEVWFGHGLPRVMGIGVSTDAFAEDTAGWHWTMDETQTLDDGTPHRIVAAGPHEHRSEVYLFAMDRPDRSLDHPQLGGSARLAALTFAGAEHELWRSRLASWLGEASAVGDVELRFEPGPHERIAVTPTFAVDAAPGMVELAAGELRLEG
jgi:hypothetical protein